MLQESKKIWVGDKKPAGEYPAGFLCFIRDFRR